MTVDPSARERVDGAWGGAPTARDDTGPYWAAVSAAVAEVAGSWQVVRDEDGVWLRVEPRGAQRTRQGWKLHVSASLTNDVQTLSAVLPVLLEAGVPWKVAADPAVLSGLNQGEAGLSQVGKFITAYPYDDRCAVALARDLDEVTRGLVGPRVPSDRRIRREGVVSYRFGGFDDRVVEGELGELLPAIAGPDGLLEPDVRGVQFSPPAWATDPFETAGLGEPPRGKGLVARRYLPTAVLHRSPRGTVHLAVDLETRTSCVLKHAEAGAARSPLGTDALSSLRSEHANLVRVQGHPSVPRVLDLVDSGDEAWLVLEAVDGVPLGLAISGGTGPSLDAARLSSWLEQLVDALTHIHGRGLVFRDLKPGNVLVSREDRIRLIDFELALPVGGAGDGTLGSRGYCSPQQVLGSPASPSDDVFSLGALLYLLLTGAEPALSPDPFDLTARAIRDLRPAVSSDVADVVARCLDVDAAQRPQSPAEVLAAYRHAVVPRVATPRSADRQLHRPVVDRREVAHRLATSLAGDTVRWAERRASLARFDGSLYSGTAGEVFALAHLVSRLGADDLVPALDRAAHTLSRWPRSVQPGLHHGEAGTGLALVRAGHALDEPALVRAGALRVDEATAEPAPALDVISGLAGQLQACLLLMAAGTPGPWEQRSALLARHLRDRATTEDGLLRWEEPASSTAGAVIGYAHGTAGMADALLDHAELTGSAESHDAAIRAARWIGSQAQQEGPTGGVHWADRVGGRVGAPMWCHGATGLGRFLLHVAASAGSSAGSQRLADGACLAVSEARAQLGPVLCHGLAGSLDLLLDAGAPYRDAVESITRLLDAFAVDRDGRLVYVSDSPVLSPPSYLTGYGGIALTQLRLADAAEPSALSVAGARTWAADAEVVAHA